MLGSRGFGELGRGHACHEGDSEMSWSRSSPTESDEITHTYAPSEAMERHGQGSRWPQLAGA